MNHPFDDHRAVLRLLIVRIGDQEMCRRELVLLVNSTSESPTSLADRGTTLRSGNRNKSFFLIFINKSSYVGLLLFVLIG